MIRTERTADYEQVYSLHYEAFGKREDESKLVERIRQSDQFVTELSIVADMDGSIAGHILLSKAAIFGHGSTVEVIVLAPLAVQPALQKKGIGSALMQEGLRRTRELGYGLVALIGHPGYYPRFGFEPARRHGLELTQYDVPDDVFMINELIQGSLDGATGELKYPQAFLHV
ncbi:GNAT family N-acetyltransferase [Paenibacillus beijingensis]|uniref:GCN5 family acetyltransferase n=1 Tax=Paenibacillus beijingensis TaxID=1126833 RepID=A0A0D5NFN5_9BACL|nr:N-acetyltransferase [Paenibacillus beijingensis]AJY73713.1 GCN5 family acetyltransferase [Paenibacillus beijingensis]